MLGFNKFNEQVKLFIGEVSRGYGVRHFWFTNHLKGDFLPEVLELGCVVLYEALVVSVEQHRRTRSRAMIRESGLLQYATRICYLSNGEFAVYEPKDRDDCRVEEEFTVVVTGRALDKELFTQLRRRYEEEIQKLMSDSSYWIRVSEYDVTYGEFVAQLKKYFSGSIKSFSREVSLRQSLQLFLTEEPDINTEYLFVLYSCELSYSDVPVLVQQLTDGSYVARFQLQESDVVLRNHSPEKLAKECEAKIRLYSDSQDVFDDEEIYDDFDYSHGTFW